MRLTLVRDTCKINSISTTTLPRNRVLHGPGQAHRLGQASTIFCGPVADLKLAVSGRARAGNRVRTGPGKPGKSWNLIIWIPGLESHGILD